MKEGFSKIVKLVLVLVVFITIFVFLINIKKQSGLADIVDNSFKETTVRGKKLVAQDMDAIYPKFYVVYFDNDNTFIIHCFNYYETESQYRLEFNRLIDDIVDYNQNNNMIRYVYSSGIGSYDEVLNELSLIIDSSNLKIYE